MHFLLQKQSTRRQGQGFKSGSKERRKGRCFNCNRFGHYARECPHKKDTPRDDDNNNYKINGNQRKNKFKNQGKRNAPIALYGNDFHPKRSRNSRYEEINVVDKQNNFILFLPSPLPLLHIHWIIG